MQTDSTTNGTVEHRIARNYCELAPAYGRDYASKAEVEVAFRGGMDFMGDYNLGFKPVGVQDFAPGVKVNLRYKRHTKVLVVTV